MYCEIKTVLRTPARFVPGKLTKSEIRTCKEVIRETFADRKSTDANGKKPQTDNKYIKTEKLKPNKKGKRKVKIMKYIIVFFVLISCIIANGQSITKRVLFLGNSYTQVNNLPQMVADAAISAGDTLLFDSNTPGGYTLQGHSTNAISLAKIAAGNWDYVVLQEQSQLPSFPIDQVETEVFPYAHLLDSIINAENPCGETVFYMTWGRKKR